MTEQYLPPMICYMSLDVSVDEESSFVDSLSLFQQIMKNAPYGLDIPISPISLYLKKQVDKILTSDDSLSDIGYKIYMLFQDEYGYCPGLSIRCNRENALAKQAVAENPVALYGAMTGPMSLNYNPGRFLIWHETLHLLGANDCYDKETPRLESTCDKDNCIMQYGPPTVSENRIILCDDNSEEIRKSVEGYHKFCKEHMTKRPPIER